MKRLGWLNRPLFAVMLIFTVFACGGGGCSGCEGCGVAPIPGGFPISDRIPNAAQVRLSESGIEFIEDNIEPILETFMPDGLTFRVPRSEVSAGITLTICEDDNCQAAITIQDLDLIPTGPNTLRAHLRIEIEGQRYPSGERAAWDGSCDLLIDTKGARSGDTRDYVGLLVDVQFQNIPASMAAREGYTRIQIDEDAIRFADGEDIENSDIDLSGGFLGLCNVGDLGFIKNFVLNQLRQRLGGMIKEALDEQLCTTRGEHGCPTGTTDRGNTSPDATCYYQPSGGECVPMLLGTDGQGDLGMAFLGGFSPGTHAPGQFVLAAGGEGEAINNGMSLFMHGGFMSMTRDFASSPGHNPCVPRIEPPELPTVPRVASFRGNVIPGTTTPAHVGIGIAEEFLDYAGYGMFDSGMLCIGAGTRLAQQLSTGLVSGLIPSLRQLAFPLTSAPLTLAIRPQLPPDFTIGTDESAPLLTVSLPQVQIDWYVWSTERYVRFMTYQTDLTIRIDLTVEGGEIVPRIEGVEATNSMVFNNELITEQPANVASSIETIISSFAGMLAGAIDPIALPSIMGFDLQVPEGGIRGVADDGHAFLGIFANLALASSAPLVQPVETTLSVSDLEIDRESMSLEGWAQGPGNRVWLHFGAEGPAGAEYEYSYRIDGMTWSRWTTDRRIRIADDVLLLQARHTVEARARVRGEARTVDLTPARAELIVDLLPPEVQVSRDGAAFVVSARDLITPDDAFSYRFRIRDGEWSAWQSSPRFEPDELVLDGGVLHVEVSDEAGNVTSTTFPLIRGVPNPAGGGSCDCGVAVGGTDRNGPLALVGSLFLLGAMLVRRRRALPRARRALTIGLIALPVVLGAQGCECSDGSGPGAPCNDECIAAAPPGLLTGSMCCEATNMCAAYDVDDLCQPGFTCPLTNLTIDGSCTVTCSECMRKPPLDPGLLATDLDLVVSETGETYVSGYSPGAPPSTQYGDLVFGTIEGDRVTWEIVDGMPSSSRIVADPDGWRGGVGEPGDDVGRWTSMADSGTSLYIAYYDATNGALKMAIGSPGAWTTHVVDDAGDSGRYASLVLLDGGAPAVAYLRVEPAADGSGRLHSSVRVAIAADTAPTGPTSWTITEVAGADMACRPAYCGAGEVCLESGACVVPTSDCADDCGDDACVGGTCRPKLPSDYVEDLPPAYGLHTNLARTPSGGLAVVWYDRGGGNLFGAELPAVGGTWSAPITIDGYVRNDPDSGDSGIGTSLFVDAAGTWHVAYVDGTEETLRYASIAGGAVTARQTIDDGATDGMTEHGDGRHIVGDDSSIVVTDGGEIRVVYQDATAQHLMLARRAAGSGEWTISVLDDEQHTGFWADQVLVGTTSYVATWWRLQSRTAPTNGVRVLTVD